MIQVVFDGYIDCLLICLLCDYLYNEVQWIVNVQCQVVDVLCNDGVVVDVKVGLIGMDKDVFSYYLWEFL